MVLFKVYAHVPVQVCPTVLKHLSIHLCYTASSNVHIKCMLDRHRPGFDSLFLYGVLLKGNFEY